jgi:hypothetical protein
VDSGAASIRTLVELPRAARRILALWSEAVVGLRAQRNPVAAGYHSRAGVRNLVAHV